MKNQLLIFTIFCTQILISQTLIINSGNTLDAEEPIHIVFQLDSIIQNNTFPINELSSEPIEISFNKVETGGYVFEDGNYRHETIEYEFDDLIIELTQESDSFIYSFNSDQNFLEFFNIPINETLKNIKFFISFSNPNFFNNEYYATNSEQYIGIKNTAEEFDVFFKEGLDESDYSNVLSISNNVISSNLTSLIETANEDIILEVNEDCGTENCGRWVGNASKNLEFPIIEDFTGDGINDMVGRVYTHYFGDIDWILTEEEKEMYFSRWVLLRGVSPNEYEAEYSFVASYDKISEGIKVYSKDLDNDGDLDIYTYPDVYHGSQENKPTNWDGDFSIYINDGIGNFTIFDETIFPRNSLVGQIDNDSDIESISAVGKYDSRYFGVGEDSSVIKIIDKVNGEYSEIVSPEIMIQPQSGSKIFTRGVSGLKMYDFNNDGIDDIILWLSQKEMYEEFFDNDGNFIGEIETTSIDENGLNRTNYFIMIEGTENGFDFTNSDFSNNIIHSYSSLPHLDNYSFDIIQNGNTDVFFYLELSPGIYANWDGYEYTGPLSKLNVLEPIGDNLVDITSSYFPNQENLNYIFRSNEPIFKDFNNDGLLDIYFWGGWSTTINEKESLFLINKTSHFEKVVVPYAGSEDAVFADFNSDGYVDLYQSLDNYLKFATNIGVFYDENGKKTINYEDNPREILNLTFNDIDRDGVEDSEDNCPEIENIDQSDVNNDGIGDVCDSTFITTITASVVVDGADATFTVETTNNEDGDWSYSLNGGDAVIVYTTELELTDLPNGDHSIYIQLVDSSGTALDPVVEQTIEFSTYVSPTITASVVVEGADATFTVETTNNDDGDWSYSLNGGDTVIVYTTELELMDLPNGDHTILFSLVDETGVPLDPAVVQTIEFSTYVAPTMTASVVVDGADATFTIATTNFVIGDSADADGHWHYELNGNDYVMAYTSELVLTDLPNGDHSILIWLVDSSHNPLDPPVEQIIEFSTFNGIPECGDTVTYSQVANGDYSISVTTDDDTLMASVTINATTEVGYDYIIVTDGAGTQLNTQVDGDFVDADFYSTDGTITVQVLNDSGVQYGDVTLVFACVSLSTPENERLDMIIYPNPVLNGDFITIQTSVNGEKYVEVFDITGKRLITTTLNADTLDVSSISTGIYLVNVTINGQSKISKLIIR